MDLALVLSGSPMSTVMATKLVSSTAPLLRHLLDHSVTTQWTLESNALLEVST